MIVSSAIWAIIQAISGVSSEVRDARYDVPASVMHHCTKSAMRTGFARFAAGGVTDAIEIASITAHAAVVMTSVIVVPIQKFAVVMRLPPPP